MSRSRLEDFLDATLGAAADAKPAGPAATPAAPAPSRELADDPVYQAKVARARARMLGKVRTGPINPDELESDELQRLALVLYGAQTGDFFALMRERSIELGATSIAEVAGKDANGAPVMGDGQLRLIVQCLASCEIELDSVKDDDLVWMVELATAADYPACEADAGTRGHARWRTRLMEAFIASAAPPPAAAEAEKDPAELVENDERLQDHMEQRRAGLAKQQAADTSMPEHAHLKAIADIKHGAADLGGLMSGGEPDHPRTSYVVELANACNAKGTEVRIFIGESPPVEDGSFKRAARYLRDPAGLGRLLSSLMNQLDELKQQCEGPMIMIRRDAPGHPAADALAAMQKACDANMVNIRKMRRHIGVLNRPVRG